MVESEWAQEAKRLLKAEMQRRGVTYAQLAAVLTKSGIDDNERNLRNKINRGNFSAAFMIQCFMAMGSHIIRLGEPEQFDMRAIAEQGIARLIDR